MELLYYWISEIALLISGVVFVRTMKKREDFRKKFIIFITVYIVFLCIIYMLPFRSPVWARIFVRMFGFCFLVILLKTCWAVCWSAAAYEAIWACIFWRMMYETWMGVRQQEILPLAFHLFKDWMGLLFLFVFGNLAAAFTFAGWISEGETKKVGPRQLISAFLIFLIIEILGFQQSYMGMEQGVRNWAISFLSQLLLILILYLQNELFKKSAMRQELAVMNLLWKKEQEQYKLSKENIALINQKCHDLKHQIRAIRSMQGKDIGQYLAEMEDVINIYEAIVKTGNEVLDTILTEKSLYCREHGITISCVADGSQMQFINTVDLYAILGNAIDNAVEAVEKFEQQEMRQIDVLIYRQQNFLIMNIVNPFEDDLVYEEELPVSTKGDERFHGFGLRSIRYLVKKYDGALSICGEDGCFSLKILIPIP